MLNSIRPLWNATANQPPAGLQTADCYALSSVIQPGFTATVVHSSPPDHVALQGDPPFLRDREEGGTSSTGGICTERTWPDGDVEWLMQGSILAV